MAANKRYKSRHYQTDFYGDTLEELAQNVKNKFPDTKVLYPCYYDSEYDMYVNMYYKGCDINTFKKISKKKKAS